MISFVLFPQASQPSMNFNISELVYFASHPQNPQLCNSMYGGQTHSRPQCLRVWECARKLWETLRRRSQNLATWASQRMLFDPTKTFCFFPIYFTAKVLCCFGIRTKGIQLMEPLENFQVSKALVVAAEKILLNVLPSHRFVS